MNLRFIYAAHDAPWVVYSLDNTGESTVNEEYTIRAVFDPMHKPTTDEISNAFKD
jgi:hypothetical protein